MIGFAVSTVSTTATSIGMIDFVASTVSTTVTLIGTIGFVASTISTKSLFSITSVFRSFRSITRIPTTHTDTADTVIRAAMTNTDTMLIRAAMAMDPRLQRRLARAGYYHGAIDGIMGPATRRAIRAYERTHNQRAYGMTDRY